MASNSAMIVLSPENAPQTKPLMLHELLFAPVLRWVCEGLRQAGIQRFFVLSPAAWIEDVRRCCPEAIIADEASDTVEDLLKDFAAGAEGNLIALHQPLWLSRSAALTLCQAEQLPWDSGFTAALRAPAQKVAVSGFDALEYGEIYAPALGGQSPACIPLNTQADLADLQYLARFDRIADLEANGVRFLDRETVYIDPQVQVGAGTVILPNVILRGETVIGENCEIGPNAMLQDSTLGNHCVFNASQGNACKVGDNSTVGPWSNLRPGTCLGKEVHIGDFVELKNTTVGDRTWAAHLTYLGDATVGADCNFGCGSVTANFDGTDKFHTTIGDRVFIGCNTNLIAPVTLESDTSTAAGTTVTEDVPSGTMAIGRSRQQNIPR